MKSIEDIESSETLIFKCLSGSRAYGLATSTSDIDLKGVYIDPPNDFFKFQPSEQVHNPSYDIVYYEIKKFLFLLSRNNPTALEILYTPPEHVLMENRIFHLVKNYEFLSLLCKETFVQYARAQIKKAQNLNKKLVNPMPVDSFDLLDFCYVAIGASSQKIKEWIKDQGHSEHNCGLAVIPHFRDTYSLFVGEMGQYRGLMVTPEGNDLQVSSIPIGATPVAVVHFNRKAFQTYSEKYKTYWEWVEKRNEGRYSTNKAHGKNYDSKNMMHVFRLLAIAKTIATEKTIRLNSFNRPFLLAIKEGSFEFKELIEKAQCLIEELDVLFEKSSLKPVPDVGSIEFLHQKIRIGFYREKGWLT